MISSDFEYVSNILTLPLYVLTSEVAVVKSRHGISVKCSRYRDTDLSLLKIEQGTDGLRFVVTQITV